MSEHLGYIDSYFNKELSPEERKIFDLRIEQDPAFAEEVAFYLNALDSVKAELAVQKKERFREIYQELRPARRPGLVRRFWPYVSVAAAVIIVVMGIYLFQSPSSPQEFANTYILEKFQKLGTTMDSGIDSVKAGINFFNDGKLDSAQIYFETILHRDSGATHDSSLFEIIEFAGITSLRMKQYNKAIEYFSRMERVSDLYSNNGTFYHAIALIERKQPGDMEKAKDLLKVVVDNNQDEKATAEKWLDKWLSNTDIKPAN